MLYVTLVACAALAAGLIYRYDIYEREPWYMLLLASGLGFGAMAFMGVLEPWTLDRFGPPPRPDLVLSAVAATHEELARLVIVVVLALLLPSQFNDPMDGIIYGSIVGLGMAIEESLFYLDLDSTAGVLLPPAEIIRLCGHLVMGGITGFAVGMARFRMRGWPAAMAGCLFISMSLHLLWDWIAFAAARAGTMAPWQTAAAVAIMITGIVIYGGLVMKASSWSKAMFDPASRKQLWGWPFAQK